MANDEHLRILKQGTAVWNQWRARNSDVHVDLVKSDLTKAKLDRVQLYDADLRDSTLLRAILLEANLAGANFNGANLAGANLTGANLRRAKLYHTDFGAATLTGADLTGAILVRANLSRANLNGANLTEANLVNTDLTGADLTGAILIDANLSGGEFAYTSLIEAQLSGTDLSRARLVRTNFERASLTGCSIYAISAWGVNLKGAVQVNLIITPTDEPTITVDNLEVAQFIYLLLNNERVRDVIDTITTKVVLILGRFTSERKTVLNAIRDELRKRDYLPVLFDFQKPASRDLTETVRTLAHLARFIIADITEPRSIPQELQAIVPDLAVPVQPLLLEGSTSEYGMFQDFPRKYHWVLAVHWYKDLDDLLLSLEEKVIAPAEAKVKELQGR